VDRESIANVASGYFVVDFANGWKTSEASARSRTQSPAGFQEDAVASSAMAMNAPPMPRARAPDPVALAK
jgi:hypothetical protein